MFVFLLDRRQRVLLTRFSGTVTDADLLDHRRQLTAMATQHSITARITDFSEVVAFKASSAIIVQLAEQQNAIPRAFIVPKPEIFGLARLYSTHNSLSDVRQPYLTRTYDEAVAHLGLDDLDFQPFE